MKFTRRGLNALIVGGALYMGLGASANAADVAALENLRTGDMKKLVLHPTPVDVAVTDFTDFDGAPLSLTDYHGKIVLLNFWATWCGPCRKEMPMLSALQSELGGDDFEVVTLATGHNPAPAMTRFFDKIGIDNLPLHRDPKQAIARNMAVLGLPTTVILNREGQEIARLTGDAEWDSESAKAILTAIIAG
ncbi:TlpA disulfide reductase family protein [Marinovum sp. 2_MG-2023]|uniref:TlpA family protein disulfide reductase n=1 Tax=unclassified Marinovum TaxID=2647166 RepID=UPI0026E3DD72|nr:MULTISPECIES: TlpA disulfide reductase family protein [unclassified Marinovum]MDO6728521.1 TlpA disulfide reductase family protein [Marinovum sp. 2_MG-2023]MDO6778063.1 TlpA disulfide reductase family protein [Marinovum sp. 1_MG-2023]